MSQRRGILLKTAQGGRDLRKSFEKKGRSRLISKSFGKEVNGGRGHKRKKRTCRL